jgi:3-phosphoshikimate 1-carboxyvinyltransferase
MIRLQLIHDRLSEAISIQLPASKSISNRLLIINKIAESNFAIDNLSDADDTQVLKQLLESDAKEVNCGLGGTSIRFILAYCYLINREVILAGEQALNKRPIGPLVDALRQLGASIDYLDKKGFPPLHLKHTEQFSNEVRFDSNISSQFVSSLLMIAPALPNGLTIHLPTDQVSFSYIDMTISLMCLYGIEVESTMNKISVRPQKYIPIAYHVSADWSAVIFWIGFLAIAGNGKVVINNLKADKIQGDEAILEWINDLGITARISEDYILFEKNEIPVKQELHFNLINNPDLAQPLAVIGAALGIKTTLTGLSTLKHKETDRINAIANELRKCDVDCLINNDTLEITGKINTANLSNIILDTYNDHRMAMSLAMLSATGVSINLNNPEVVSKSYPQFFEELKKFCVITKK